MSAREGKRVTEVGDTEEEIMGDRDRGRKRDNARQRGRWGGIRVNESEVKRGAGGRASQRESVSQSLYVTEDDGV